MSEPVELNEQQRQAVLHLEGPLLVHAPVGTGKTTVLAHRAAHAIASGRDPASLLCLSFTNRAARQMRERIASLLGGKGNEIAVRTFHGFCTHVLRLEADNLGLHADFTICDEADARELLLDAWRQQTARASAPERLSDVLARLAERLKGPQAIEDPDPEGLLLCLAEELGLEDLSAIDGLDPVRLVVEYNARLEASGALDFADLIARVNRLFVEREDRLAYWQELYPWAQVDEVQDTTAAEYGILARLGAVSRNLAFFGDLDQTIYEWRGSQPWRLLSEFERRFAPIQQIELTRNYRSSRLILEACVSLIRTCDRAVTRTIECFSGLDGKKVFLHGDASPDEEARWIARSIKQITTKYGVERRHMAILVRTNQQAAELSQVLAAEKVEHFLVDRVPFFRQPEIKDALALVRSLLNPLDISSLQRILGRGTLGVPGEVLNQVRRLPSSVGLKLIDLVDPLTHEDLDPFGLLLRRLEEGRVVLFDVETTGLDVTRDDVVELAAVRLGTTGEIASFQSLLRTDRPLEEAARVHGITAEMLTRDGRPPGEVFAAFRRFVSGCVLVGHNVHYDLNIVRSQMRRLGLDWEEEPRAYDTLDMSRRLFSLPRYTLTAVCQSLSLSAMPIHRAMDDVQATWQLLRRMIPPLLASRAARQRTAGQFTTAFREVSEKLEHWRKLAECERPIILLNRVLDESGLLSHWEKQDQGNKRAARLHELATLFGQYDDPDLAPREALLNLTHLAALGNEMDRYLESEDKVLVLTAHQAKGLEFDTVFIAGATDRQFPSPRSVREGRVAEEHRLFYVAMTRARSRLIISYPTQNGDGRTQEPSRFLAVLPTETFQQL
jgi:DNA helicase-2/ATP-dependent DNA helicase PcrA